MQLPVSLRIRPSPLMTLALVGAHGLAVAAVLASLGIPLAILPSGAILASLGFALSRALRPSIVGLVLKSDGTIEIEHRERGREPATVEPRTMVFPWLVILSLEAEGRGTSLALPPDALGSEEHRLLRLWLRWKAVSESPA